MVCAEGLRFVRGALAVLFAILGLLGCDAALFRTRLYPSVLEPDSSTGLFELILRRERIAQTANGDNLVLTLGDSRFAYAPRLANQIAARTGYIFRHAGVAGTDARSWYYMLRDLDPVRRRYRAIVFGVDDYDDEDGLGDINDDIRALHYVLARLRWTDVWDFARSFHDPHLRWEAFRGAVLKGLIYQTDLRAFLSDPQKRIRYVKLCHRGYEYWTYTYEETARSMAGLEVDWAAWKAKLPADADANQRDTLEFLLHKPAPQTGNMAEFRRLWFGRVLDLYRGSPTRIIFLRLPRGAIPRPANLVEKKSSSIREFASRSNVILCPEHDFEFLERPELHKDALHLNREGIARFSPKLAEEIGGMLGAPRARTAGANAL